MAVVIVLMFNQADRNRMLLYLGWLLMLFAFNLLLEWDITELPACS